MQDIYSLEFWLPIFIILGVLVALVGGGVKIGKWIGEVNSNQENFKKFMTEVREDLKWIREKIFKITSLVATPNSPIRLTDLGHRVSNQVGGKEIAEKLADGIAKELWGLSAYEIQEFCFDYMDKIFIPNSEQEVSFKDCAYENGIDITEVRRAIAVELRDLVIKRLGAKE